MGDLYTWLLSGTVTSSGAYLDPPRFADTRWQIRGLADFNADGKVDVLWHHQATGELYVWYLNGTAVTSGAFLTPEELLGHAVADPRGDRPQQGRQAGHPVAPPGERASSTCGS